MHRVEVLVYDDRVVRVHVYYLCVHCTDILTHLEPVEYRRAPLASQLAMAV